jgi:hypothetical protein
MRVRIDTDFAGDTDDACAVAMTLGRPEVEIVGITTTADPDGLRAGYLCRFLELAGRLDVPVAAGAGRSLTTGSPMGGLPDRERYWATPWRGVLRRRAGLLTCSRTASSWAP